MKWDELTRVAVARREIPVVQGFFVPGTVAGYAKTPEVAAIFPKYFGTTLLEILHPPLGAGGDLLLIYYTFAGPSRGGVRTNHPAARGDPLLQFLIFTKILVDKT